MPEESIGTGAKMLAMMKIVGGLRMRRAIK